MDKYDQDTLRQIEDELGIKIYPGTEIMRDVGSYHFVKSSADSDAVLVPQPTNSPHDPLNWNRWWKMSVVAISVAMSFSQAMGPLALAPFYPELMKSFDSDLPSVVQFTGVGILVLGFSNFFWMPLLVSYGRRPVALFSTALCIASNVWRAVSPTYGSFLGACILNGFAAGPAETQPPQIIADTMFLHERGAYQTLYFSFYFGGLMVGSIISGPMAEKVGWRNFFWLNTALLCTILLLLVFFFPDTIWHRPRQTTVAAAEGTKTQEAANIGQLDTIEEVKQKANATLEDSTGIDPWLGRGYPSKKQFMLWQRGDNSVQQLAISFITPWTLLFYPIVHLAAFVVSWSASCFLILNLTQSQAFAAPPYNLKSQTIGLFNIAILIGAFIGLATNGPLSDWVSMKATKRNGGIREPEMRLPAMLPYLIVCIIGNFIVGFGYQYKWPWEAIVIVGYACAGIQVAALPAIVSTYAIDSYRPMAGMLFVTVTVNKNLWGYGLSNFVPRWVEQDGFLKPIMLNMCLTTLWCACAVVFYIWGKTFRKWTANSKVHDM